MNQSVRKAVSILSAISDQDNTPAHVSAISEKTGINPATCVHILEELSSLGLAERLSRREGYVLGPYLYYLTRHGRYRHQLIQLCNPVMQWLNRVTKQTVVLNMLYSNLKLIIHHVTGECPIPQGNQSIMLGDIYCSATGRIMMANMSSDKFAQLYAKIGLPTQEQWPDITDLDSLKSALEDIRIKGYSQLTKDDIKYFAFYISDYRDSDVSIGLTCRADDKNSTFYLSRLKVAANEINRRRRFEI